ncbi:MAG TPA: hypothetical protein ENH55_13210 [Aurantimonas coralicida]|uniref:Uncharacterized protein n=2 Tax=root TaxID=1 RepID=A0A9C9ND79_9HYPH|nr:hypothetical protein [Aurantimonas coralicida]HET99681.1 hypothetical protein [Aurantimonas coralicida]
MQETKTAAVPEDPGGPGSEGIETAVKGDPEGVETHAEPPHAATVKPGSPPPEPQPQPPAPAQVAPVPVQAARLHFGRLKEAEHARRTLFADIPAGTEIATILEPGYWAHHTASIRPMDLIEAFCEDGSWEALLRVMFVGRVEVRVSPIHVVQHEQADVADLTSDLYVVKWRGPGAKWGVLNRDTGEVIKDRFYPKSQAVAYLRDHLRKMKT